MQAIEGIRIYMIGIIPLAFQYAFVDCLTALGQPRYAIALSYDPKNGRYAKLYDCFTDDLGGKSRILCRADCRYCQCNHYNLRIFVKLSENFEKTGIGRGYRCRITLTKGLTVGAKRSDFSECRSSAVANNKCQITKCQSS